MPDQALLESEATKFAQRKAVSSWLGFVLSGHLTRFFAVAPDSSFELDRAALGFAKELPGAGSQERLEVDLTALGFDLRVVAVEKAVGSGRKLEDSDGRHGVVRELLN